MIYKALEKPSSHVSKVTLAPVASGCCLKRRGLLPTDTELPRGGTLLRPDTPEGFEQLARAMMAAIYGDWHADFVGRNGQSQGGLDVLCHDQAGRAIGVQCKLSKANPFKAPPVRQLTDAVVTARTAYPSLAEFIFLTTAPNDTGLQAEARRLHDENAASGRFSVRYHSWDWIQEALRPFPKIAEEFGLVSRSQASAPISPLMLKVAERLGLAMALINQGRDDDEALSTPQLAAWLGAPDWSALEAIQDGTSKATLADLEALARKVGLCSEWLIEGRRTPFLGDEGPYDAAAQFETILALAPKRVVFVRENQAPYSALVAVQLDDLRWRVLEPHPAGPNVGSTGRSQLFELCTLIRRLYGQYGLAVQFAGKHVSPGEFQKLLSGEIYPGALLRIHWNDPWWQDLGELSVERASDTTPAAIALVEAIKIAKSVLAEYQTRPAEPWRAKVLVEGRFPPRANVTCS